MTIHIDSLQAVLLTGVNGIAQLLAVTAIFILVLALTYFTTRFIGSYQKGKLEGSNIRIMETQRLSNNKLIQIVVVGDKYFAVAVCKDTVTLLGEVNKDSLKEKELPVSGKENFESMLNKFRRKNQKTEEEDREDR